MSIKMKIRSPWSGEEEVTISKTKYAKGGLAIRLMCFEDGFEEPYAMLTVNLKKVPEGCAYVDTNNLPYAEDFIMKYKLGKKVLGQDAVSGYCVYPLYHFDMDALDKYAKERG